MADILVAEDYPATRSVLRTLLRGAGHTVRFAVNGDQPDGTPFICRHLIVAFEHLDICRKLEFSPVA